jgi:hypothetical protein
MGSGPVASAETAEDQSGTNPQQTALRLESSAASALLGSNSRGRWPDRNPQRKGPTAPPHEPIIHEILPIRICKD